MEDAGGERKEQGAGDSLGQESNSEEDNSSEYSGEETAESESDHSRLPSDSIVKAMWENQFSFAKHLYVGDERGSTADERDLCQQLINKEASQHNSSKEDEDSILTTHHQDINDSDSDATLVPPSSNNAPMLNEQSIKSPVELQPGKQPTSRLKDETGKSFKKSVPLDPDETWDFSLRAINQNYGSKHLWIEGAIYQKLIGECLHEMHHVPCECDEKKKISVCRLCPTVFCSNQCFKKTLKIQTGQESGAEGGATDTPPKTQDEQPKSKPQVMKKSSNPERECARIEPLTRQSFEGRPADKPSFGFKNNKPPFPNTRPDRDRDGGGGGVRQQQQQPRAYSQNGASNPGRGFERNQPEAARARPSQTLFMPTPVLMNRALDSSCRVGATAKLPPSPQQQEPEFHRAFNARKFTGQKSEQRASLGGPCGAVQERGSGEMTAVFRKHDHHPEGKTRCEGGWPRTEIEGMGGGRAPSSTQQEAFYSAASSEKTESSGSSYHSANWYDQPPNPGYKPNTNPSSSNPAPYTPKTRPTLFLAPSRSESDYGGFRDSSASGIDPAVVPVGLPLPVRYVRGTDFSDFSVMTPEGNASFARLHPFLQTCPRRKMEHCQFNSFCMLQYGSSDTEKAWFRGIITRKLAAGKVGVYFFDLGMEDTVDEEAVYQLPSELSKDSPYAIRVRCINVRADMTDPELSDQFDNLVRKGLLKIRITHQDKSGLFRLGCQLDVEYMNKWFDAGVLLQKLLLGHKVSEEEIGGEEEKGVITPFPKVKGPAEHLLLHFSQKMEANVVFVVSPNEFYIQSQELLDTFDMSGMLESIRPGTLQPLRTLGELSRLFFLIWDEDGTWKRVRVEEVGSDPGTVVVRKIDVGQVLTLPLAKLSHLPEELSRLPSCVQRCSFPLKPLSRRRDRAALWDKATAFLNQQTPPTKSLVKVFSIDESNTHIVDLYTPQSHSGCIATFLENGWADLSPNLIPTK